MNVSIIIPVRSGTESIAAALAALRAQTLTSWEAIVVDGSALSEIAAAIAHSAEQDPRIRIVSLPGSGINEARNRGANLARFTWLLFFDPEDQLVPELLARLTHVVAADPSFDAVYSKWAYVAPDGALLAEEFWGQPGDMFALFASRPAFPLHASIIRKSLFDVIGGFDATCRTCADWDLWQRIARIGARFGMVDEVLALIAMCPEQESPDLHRLLTDGLHLIALGHAPDSRVANLLPPHANGLPPEQASHARFLYACTVAGRALGRGEDARPLLEALKAERAPSIDPYEAALSIFIGALRSAGRGPVAWSELWPASERPVGEFLVALEAHSQSSGLVRRVASRLERMILEQAPLPRPLTIGTTHGIRIEITEPIPDLELGDPIERVHCIIAVEGEPLGTLELPVCDRVVPAYVLADAIAAQFAWPILGRYCERTIYRNLIAKPSPDGVSLYQGSECLATALPDDATTFWRQAHDQIGWTIFLQEIWGRSDIRVGTDPLAANRAADACLALELSEPLPNVAASGALKIIPMVGGVALGVVPIDARGDVVAAEELRAAITAASGFELCRAAVREGVLGRPLATPASLRARLAEAAARRCTSTPVPHAADDTPLTYDAAWAGAEALSNREHALVLAQRDPTAIGTSASRRARLPVAVARELIELAAVAGEPVLEAPAPLEHLTSALYMPNMILGRASASFASDMSANRSGGSDGDAAGVAEHDPASVREKINTANQVQSDAQAKRARARLPLRAAPVVRAFEKTLRRVKKLRSPVYRGQMLRRARYARLPLPHIGAKMIRFAKPVLPAKVRDRLLPHGVLGSIPTARTIGTHRLPILMYHRVAPSGLPAMGRFRVPPDAFEAQLRYLRDAGYHSITLEQWRAAQAARKPVAGRAVLLTFDDGYVDFLTYAWPLLKQYGFSAIVFLVADHVGRSNDWDHVYGEEVPLMSWNDIHWLQRQGIVFGSHTASHHPLTSLSAEGVVREGARSRAILECELASPISAIAYPYGDFDPTVEHLIGACGYTFGLSCRPGLSTLQDSALALPRIEVTGDDSLQTFAANLQQ